VFGWLLRLALALAWSRLFRRCRRARFPALAFGGLAVLVRGRRLRLRRRWVCRLWFFRLRRPSPPRPVVLVCPVCLPGLGAGLRLARVFGLAVGVGCRRRVCLMIDRREKMSEESDYAVDDVDEGMDVIEEMEQWEMEVMYAEDMDC
jgi:hypothetical protein